jgi:hypothetical protein
MKTCGRVTYRSTYSQLEVSGQLHIPEVLLSGKGPPLPIGEEAAWAPEPVWTLWSREESLASAGNRIQIPQSLSPYHSHYTD